MKAETAAACAATWPAAALHTRGPWTLRDGQGGGKRVSAASAHGPVSAADISLAEDAMRALGQEPLFVVGEDDQALDVLLEQAGYQIDDPVVVMAAPIAVLATTPPPPVSAFTIWPPLQIMLELWAEAGIGPQRLAVMQRAPTPKTAVMGRSQDRVAGVGFVALHQGQAVLHAMEVAEAFRRQGTAINMMRAAAFWAQDQGAEQLIVQVRAGNQAARALYTSLNLQVVGHYHYRTKSQTEA